MFCHITQAIESYKDLGWKRPFGSSSPTVTPILPNSPLNHPPKSHSYTALKSLQEWWLHHCSEQPVLFCFCKGFFPNIQAKQITIAYQNMRLPQWKALPQIQPDLLALQVWLQSCSLISTEVSDIESLSRDAKLLGEKFQCQFTSKFLQKETWGQKVNAKTTSTSKVLATVGISSWKLSDFWHKKN